MPASRECMFVARRHQEVGAFDNRRFGGGQLSRSGRQVVLGQTAAMATAKSQPRQTVRESRSSTVQGVSRTSGRDASRPPTRSRTGSLDPGERLLSGTASNSGELRLRVEPCRWIPWNGRRDAALQADRPDSGLSSPTVPANPAIRRLFTYPSLTGTGRSTARATKSPQGRELRWLPGDTGNGIAGIHLSLPGK
jgi:hypothetical protein